MNVLVIGNGSWGHRVANKLRVLEGFGYLGVYDERIDASSFDTLDDALSSTPDAVVIATPASPHGARSILVQQAVNAGVKRIRIEKPLALSLAEAEEIIDICSGSALLTVGYTLLHHPLYAAVFAYLDATQQKVQGVDAIRIGRRPAHRISASVDLGSHAASIAAYVRAPIQLHAAYQDDSSMRITIFKTQRGVIKVNELEGSVVTPHGPIRVTNQLDALDMDLNAWLHGTHRGTPEVAIHTQQLVEDHLKWLVTA